MKEKINYNQCLPYNYFRYEVHWNKKLIPLNFHIIYVFSIISFVFSFFNHLESDVDMGYILFLVWLLMVYINGLEKRFVEGYLND